MRMALQGHSPKHIFLRNLRLRRVIRHDQRGSINRRMANKIEVGVLNIGEEQKERVPWEEPRPKFDVATLESTF